MKIIVNTSLVVVILLSAAVFAAKPKKQTAEPNTPLAKPNTSVVEPNKVAETNQISAAAVTVNGTAITEAQIEAILGPRMAQMAGRVPENMIPQYRQQIRKYVVEQLVVEELVAQEEKRNNIDVNQAELDERVSKQVAEQNLTVDEFKALLKAYGTTFGEYQQNMRKKLMLEKLMDIQFAGKLQTPTDQQAEAYYNENIQQYRRSESIHTKHILIAPVKDSNDPNQAKAAAKAKAQEILEKIKAGENFEELAKQYSACPSAANGGDLGMQPRGTFVPEFEKAAYAAKPGGVSEVVETEFGFHIIKPIEHIEGGVASFEQVKDDIKQVLADKQKEQIIMDYIKKIKAEADIKYADEADKLEPEISGGKSAPPSRRRTDVQNSDGNNPKKD